MIQEKNSNSTEYISLQEATEYCNYSQEYLSLRARQGKLKSIKLGRNWVTKKEWLEEYLESVEKHKNNLKTKKFALPRREGEALSFGVAPPENLPAESLSRQWSFFQIRQSRFVLMVGTVFVLLILGSVFGKTFFQNVAKDMPALGNRLSITADQFAAIGAQEVLKSTLNTFKEYGQWVSDLTFRAGKKIVQGYFVANNFVKRKISQGFRAISQIFKKPEKIVEERFILKPTKEGLVVIPSTEKDEEVKEKIKEAFSDEVRIEMADKTSGIIIPVFRERVGEKYMYLLVPIKN